jgi:transposase
MMSISLRSENETKKTNPQTRVQGKSRTRCLSRRSDDGRDNEKFDVHANQVTDWKKLLLSSSPEVLGRTTSNKEESEEEVQVLHAKIGQLTMENDFLERGLE